MYQSNYIKNANFEYEDAIDFFNGNDVNKANVLILQYVISHFYNTNQIEKINEFYDNLIERIVSHRTQNDPFVVIINDVNSKNRGRDFFLDFAKKLSKAGLKGTFSQYYFDYNIQSEFQRYGHKHPDKHILYGTIPRKLDKYEPWENCSSAQLLIEIM